VFFWSGFFLKHVLRRVQSNYDCRCLHLQCRLSFCAERWVYMQWTSSKLLVSDPSAFCCAPSLLLCCTPLLRCLLLYDSVFAVSGVLLGLSCTIQILWLTANWCDLGCWDCLSLKQFLLLRNLLLSYDSFSKILSAHDFQLGRMSLIYYVPVIF